MIKSLRINNVALIDEIKVDFDNGFNVFTGETGAGKSIIIDAITLLLGGKFDKNIIKEGCDSARVEALFQIDLSSKSKVIEVLNDLGVDFDDVISLSRVINLSGKSEYRLNGDITTMNAFKKVSGELIDIFGQHDNLKLLDRDNHIKFLDEYIGQDIYPLKESLKEEMLVLNSINKNIREIGDNPEKRAREIDFLKFEIEDIEKQSFIEGEEEDLLNRKQILANSEKLYNATTSSIDCMDGSNNVLDAIKYAVSQLGSVAGIDKGLDDCRERLSSVRWELSDVVDTLSQYVSSINYSDSEYEKILNRLDVINDYKRKYGNTISNILDYLSNSKKRLEMLLNCEEQLSILENEKKKILHNIYNKSIDIHNMRKNRASIMTDAIICELQGLGMPSAKLDFAINMPSLDDDFESMITVDGLDDVEFLFSANLGQSVRPLEKIISGGELSRFALSFKTVVGSKDNNKTMIFDEIDTGIGGNTGSIVGKKLTKISKGCQVLCITHLAQIASFADSHYQIVKVESDNKTTTYINRLDGDKRQAEISRMIGSIININYANLHSSELLCESHNYKVSLG